MIRGSFHNIFCPVAACKELIQAVDTLPFLLYSLLYSLPDSILKYHLSNLCHAYFLLYLITKFIINDLICKCHYPGQCLQSLTAFSNVLCKLHCRYNQLPLFYYAPFLSFSAGCSLCIPSTHTTSTLYTVNK